MTRRRRPGAMPRWQRWPTYAALAVCATSGTVWFVLGDVYDATPTQTHAWWIAHGISAALTTLAIGAALGQHAIVNFRASRARRVGATNVALMALLIVTSFHLLYGGGSGHDAVHWTHVSAGLAAIVVFTVHVMRGRAASPSREPATRRS